MKRLAAIGFVAVAGFLTIPLAAQRPTAAPLEIRALSAKPELVSGGDVLVQIAGPANLTAKNVTVRLNGKDVTASFKPAAESKAVVGLLTDLQVGSNAVQASMRGSKATAQLTIVNHPISGPVIYSPHQTPFVCETQAHGLGAPLDADCTASTKVEYFYRSNATPATPARIRATLPRPTTRTDSGAARPPTRSSRSIRTGLVPPTSRRRRPPKARRFRTSFAVRWEPSIARSTRLHSCTSQARRCRRRG